MRRTPKRTTPLGELVAAAFDGARLFSTDPAEVARLATQAVEMALRRGHALDLVVAAASAGAP